jgi:Argonaute siRNA chaperone (ARC) complex subunit Arb1
MFGGGLDAKAIDSMDAQEIAVMTATDYVGRDKSSTGTLGQNSEWVVDFEGVAKGYLYVLTIRPSSNFLILRGLPLLAHVPVLSSHKVPNSFDITNPNEIKLCTSLIRNFLNYILHHNVCPEYSEQVFSARAICSLAEQELTAVVAVSHRLPGDFNMACSALFGGRYKGLYSGNQEWAKDMGFTVGMSDERARKVVHAGLAAMGTLEQCQQAKDGGLVVTKEENIGFEVTEILKADEETRDFFKNTFGDDLKCLGTLRGRQWINPAWLEEDESDDEGERAPECPEEYEFWVEEDVLVHFMMGMKVEMTVRHLNCGVSYFDTVFNVHCSFYTYLENERMSSYKECAAIGEADGLADVEFEEDNGAGAEPEPEPEE